jgi:hypothetical protein
MLDPRLSLTAVALQMILSQVRQDWRNNKVEHGIVQMRSVPVLKQRRDPEHMKMLASTTDIWRCPHRAVPAFLDLLERQPPTL